MTIDDIILNDLVKEIRTFTDYDFSEFDNGSFCVLREFSNLNRLYLKKYFDKVKNNCKAILEIGVLRNTFDQSSTGVLLDNKLDETFYFGIDLEDRSSIDNSNKNIYTLKENSSNFEKIMDFVNSKGISEFDFIFIDGYHSINQVLDDWKFTEFLSENGIVGFHDTNNHCGPRDFVNNVNTDKWKVDILCKTPKSDWGIAFLQKK